MAKVGGARPGAGRRKGGVNAKTLIARKQAEKALNETVTPLSVMLEAMIAAHAAGDLALAHNFAKDAAPYVHPRLTAVTAEHSGKGGGPIEFENVTDADRAKALAAFVARTKANG